MKSIRWPALALAFALASCARKTPTAPVVVVPAGPSANTPAGAVNRLAWAMLTRDVAEYSGIITDDYEFQFGASDSSGNRFPGHCLNHAQELAAMQHLMAGGSARPPASDIRITISSFLAVSPDPRPGMDPRWHRTVHTPMELRITIDAGGVPEVNSVSGNALLFVVRGDSAFFLPARATSRDSTRWFISRWEDETGLAGGVPGLHADPARNSSLGSIKALYLDPAPSGPPR